MQGGGSHHPYRVLSGRKTFEIHFPEAELLPHCSTGKVSEDLFNGIEFLPVSLCVSFCLSFYVSLCVSLHVSVSLCISVCPSLSVSLSLPVSLCLSMSLCLCVSL